MEIVIWTPSVDYYYPSEA